MLTKVRLETDGVSQCDHRILVDALLYELGLGDSALLVLDPGIVESSTASFSPNARLNSVLSLLVLTEVDGAQPENPSPSIPRKALDRIVSSVDGIVLLLSDSSRIDYRLDESRPALVQSENHDESQTGPMDVAIREKHRLVLRQDVKPYQKEIYISDRDNRRADGESDGSSSDSANESDGPSPDSAKKKKKKKKKSNGSLTCIQGVKLNESDHTSLLPVLNVSDLHIFHSRRRCCHCHEQLERQLYVCTVASDLRIRSDFEPSGRRETAPLKVELRSIDLHVIQCLDSGTPQECRGHGADHLCRKRKKVGRTPTVVETFPQRILTDQHCT